jgi:hypothetical protein
MGQEVMITMSDDEALELYRFTVNDYINVNHYPALTTLLNRVSKRVKEIHAQPDVDRGRGTAALGVSLSSYASGLDRQ